jgi:uncharacterized protein
MAKVDLGEYGSGGTATLDVPLLLATRLLIQANSGGGKSYLLRRIYPCKPDIFGATYEAVV